MKRILRREGWNGKRPYLETLKAAISFRGQVPGVEYRYWAVAEEGIYFVATEGSESFVKFIDFATLRITKIMRLERKLVKDLSRGLALSPDGLSLLCTLVEQDSSDIMLIENFR